MEYLVHNTQFIIPTPVHLLTCSPVHLPMQYTGLRVLRLSHIPLFKGRGASEVRPLVIARMQHVEVFNGSPVSARERMESEKSYL